MLVDHPHRAVLKFGHELVSCAAHMAPSHG
jgi:hypothetical protein